MPISSQWPSVVSLPFERSISRPATAGAPAIGGQPSSGSTLPRPSASRFGRSRPPTAFATFPSVSEPSSPNSAASGSAPAPTASNTMTHARGIGLFYEGRAHGSGPAGSPRLHRLRDLAGRRHHVDGGPLLAAREGRRRGQSADSLDLIAARSLKPSLPAAARRAVWSRGRVPRRPAGR